MNVQLFLKRLAIALTVLAVLVQIGVMIVNQDMYAVLVMAAICAAFVVIVWTCYWIACGLFITKN